MELRRPLGSRKERGPSIVFRFDDFGLVEHVRMIDNGGSPFATSNGIKPSSSRQDMLRAFGASFTPTGTGIRYEAAGIEFQFDKDRVSAIEVLQGAKTADGKPTLAQTYRYLKSYFDEDFFRNGKHFECSSMSLHVNITKLEFAGCLMTSGYTERIRYIGPDLPNETRDIRHTTDLSKVTSIALGSRGEQFVCYGMIFKPSKRDEWVLPFARTDEGSFEKMREERIPRRARL